MIKTEVFFTVLFKMCMVVYINTSWSKEITHMLYTQRQRDMGPDMIHL